MQERSEMEREIERMERLLETSMPSRRQFVFGAAAAIGAALLGGRALLKRQADRRELAEQLQREVQEIKKRCILETPIISDLSKNKELVEIVHRDTGVPQYFLYGMFEFNERAGWWHYFSGCDIGHPTALPIRGKNIGMRKEILNDPDQCLRGAAKNYFQYLRKFGKETIAIAKIIQDNLQSFDERYPDALEEADEVNRYRIRHLRLKNDPDFAVIDRLVEKGYEIDRKNHIPINPKDKLNWLTKKDEGLTKQKNAIEKQISSELKRRGYKWGINDRFEAYLAHLHHWERNRWWVKNLATNQEICAILKLKYLENGRI